MVALGYVPIWPVSELFRDMAVTVYAQGTEVNLSECQESYTAQDGDVLTGTTDLIVNIASDHGTVVADRCHVADCVLNKTVTLTVTPDDGYALEGISVNDGAVSLTESSDGTYSFTMPEGIANVKAVWNPIVTFDTDGGSTVDEQKVTEGRTVTIPPYPTKDGFTFMGWQLNGIR